MEIKDKVNSVEWNSLVRGLPEGTIFQTTYWADYLGRKRGFLPFFCIASDNGVYKGILLLWIEILSGRARPHNWLLRNLEYFSKKLNVAYGNWMYGPLIFDDANRDIILSCFIKEIDKFAKSEKLVLIRSISPPIRYPEAISYDDMYVSHRFKAIAKSTLFIDLSKDSDDIWKELKKGTKEDVRKSERKSVTSVFLEKSNLEEYKNLIAQTRRRKKLELPPFYPDDDMWDMLKTEVNCLEIIAARRNGEMLGAMGLLEYNGIIFRMGSCQADVSYRDKLNVNDLITWESIKWGARTKKRIYDLTGIPSYSKNREMQGLRNFKMKWSRKLIPYSSYEKIYRPNAAKIVSVLKKIS